MAPYSSYMAAATVALAMMASAPVASAADSLTNQCMTGKYKFSADRTYTRSNAVDIYDPSIDVSGYDFAIDYSSSNVAFDGDAMLLRLSPPPGDTTRGEGVRIAHTRPVLYGRYSAAITAPKAALGGVVTTFITMSEEKDEIDWEIVGASGTTAQSNVFFRGVPETGVWGGTHDVGGQTDETHVYTIDWKPDVVVWSIDGKEVRRHTKAGSEFESDLTRAAGYSGKVQWFPTTPSMIQFSVWDGGNAPDPGTARWAGGPIDFSNDIRAKYEYLDVQCYDDSGKEVAAAAGAKAIGLSGGSNNATATSLKTTVGAGMAGGTTTLPSLSGVSNFKPSSFVTTALAFAGAVAMSSFIF